MINRPRRLRKTAIIREAVSETKLSKEMFVFPYFVTNGKKIKREIPSMPGIFHFSADTIIKDIEKGLKSGVNKILLFGTGEKKSENASSSHSHNAVIPRAIKEIKKAFGDDLYIITDVCLCAYTTHGHCGVIDHNYVQNDKSVEIIAKMALTHAQAGADMVAPSDMMDGRIAESAG
jgi:porphobilinogen synthase